MAIERHNGRPCLPSRLTNRCHRRMLCLGMQMPLVQQVCTYLHMYSVLRTYDRAHVLRSNKPRHLLSRNYWHMLDNCLGILRVTVIYRLILSDACLGCYHLAVHLRNKYASQGQYYRHKALMHSTNLFTILFAQPHYHVQSVCSSLAHLSVAKKRHQGCTEWYGVLRSTHPYLASLAVLRPLCTEYLREYCTNLSAR